MAFRWTPQRRRDGDFSESNAGKIRGRTYPPELRGYAMQQGQDTILRRLGKAFHVYVDETAHEPLPRRWVELIRYLDEQERKRSDNQRSERERDAQRRRA
jgi:hypothetical protein